MNNVKPTPGPWSASPVSGIVGSLISSRDGNVAAAMPQKDSAVTVANARLIAAAPELLSALKECTAALEFFDTAVKGYRHADLVALIAKAECDPPEAR